MAELMAALYDDTGLRCQWQQVEDGRANALGTLDGRGRRARASCSTATWTRRTRAASRGSRDVPGFQPEAFVGTDGCTASASRT